MSDAFPSRVAKPPAQASTIAANTARYYNDNAQDYVARTVGADMSALYGRFLPWVRKGGAILDVGCGSGRDLRYFRGAGFEPIGIDTSIAMVEYAQKLSGAPCYQMGVQQLDVADQFDGVWACASLLHLPKIELVSALTSLRISLRANGAIFVSMKLGQGEGTTDDGRFFCCYEEPELRSLLLDSGLEVRDSWSSSDAMGRHALVWINVIGTPLAP